MSTPNNTPTTNNISSICDSKMSLQECENKISERQSMDYLYNSLKNTLNESTPNNTPTINNISSICDSKISLQECENKISERQSMDDLYNSLKNTLNKSKEIELIKPYIEPSQNRIKTDTVYIDGELMYIENMIKT